MDKPKLEEYEVPSLSLDETNGMGVVILPIKQYFKVFRKEQLKARHIMFTNYQNNSRKFKKDFPKEYDLFCQSNYDYFIDWLYHWCFEEILKE